MRRALAIVMVVGLGGACGGDGNSIGSATFQQSCQSARDRACERGFACDSFFAKAHYNSVEHCKSEAQQELAAMAQQLDARQLASCADVCDVMKGDIEAVSCDDFDKATFNSYECGN